MSSEQWPFVYDFGSIGISIDPDVRGKFVDDMKQSLQDMCNRWASLVGRTQCQHEWAIDRGNSCIRCLGCDVMVDKKFADFAVLCVSGHKIGSPERKNLKNYMEWAAATYGREELSGD